MKKKRNKIPERSDDEIPFVVRAPLFGIRTTFVSLATADLAASATPFAVRHFQLATNCSNDKTMRFVCIECASRACVCAIKTK